MQTLIWKNIYKRAKNIHVPIYLCVLEYVLIFRNGRGVCQWWQLWSPKCLLKSIVLKRLLRPKTKATESSRKVWSVNKWETFLKDSYLWDASLFWNLKRHLMCMYTYCLPTLVLLPTNGIGLCKRRRLCTRTCILRTSHVSLNIRRKFYYIVLRQK